MPRPTRAAQVLQLFDSWVGNLSPDDYRRFVQPHMKRLFASLRPGVPTIHFGTDTGSLLELQKEAGGDVIGLDWRVELDRAWDRLGPEVAVQGNLDPVALFARTGSGSRPQQSWGGPGAGPDTFSTWDTGFCRPLRWIRSVDWSISCTDARFYGRKVT